MISPVPTIDVTCKDLSLFVADLSPTVGPWENRPTRESSAIFKQTANVNCSLTGQSSAAAFILLLLFSRRSVPLDLSRHRSKKKSLIPPPIFLIIITWLIKENPYKLKTDFLEVIANCILLRLLIKKRWDGWDEHCALGRGETYSTLVGKSEGLRPLGITGCGWENNHKTDFRETWREFDSAGSGWKLIAGCSLYGNRPSLSARC
jgi:hypothetical protein